MRPHLFIAIDPGASGGYVIRDGTGRIVEVAKYVDLWTIRSRAGWLQSVTTRERPAVAVIERVWASPVMGVAAAFAFGENYGAWVAAMAVSGLPVFAVTPQVWQKVAAPEVTGQGAERKRALQELAQRRHPGIRATLAVCDALLLSDYAWTRIQADERLGEQL